jgi:cell division protease FtsH
MHCADRTAAQIDDVVKEMLREAYAKAKELLGQNLDALHKIAAYLIQKETITGKEFMEIYRHVLKERKGEADGAEKDAEVGNKTGAEMALTVDSEERVITPAEKIEAVLAEKANNTWSSAMETDDSVVDV